MRVAVSKATVPTRDEEGEDVTVVSIEESFKETESQRIATCEIFFSALYESEMVETQPVAVLVSQWMETGVEELKKRVELTSERCTQEWIWMSKGIERIASERTVSAVISHVPLGGGFGPSAFTPPPHSTTAATTSSVTV